MYCVGVKAILKGFIMLCLLLWFSLIFSGIVAMEDVASKVLSPLPLEGATSLRRAASEGDEKAVRVLLKGCSRNLLEFERAAPRLNLAASYGAEQAVKNYLEAGDDVDTISGQRELTPLHCALAEGHLSIAEILLYKRANSNAVCDRRWSPLCYAAEYGNEQAIRLLIRYGADLDASHGYGADLDITNRYAYPDVVDLNNETPLHIASRRANYNALSALLENGALVEARDIRGRKPLHVIGNSTKDKEKSLFAFNVLVQNGASPHSRDNRGRTPLHCAITNYLEKSNFNPYKKYGIPLYIVERLILEGAAIDATDNQRRTALHYAVKSQVSNNFKCLNGRECIQLLINNKATLEKRDIKNKTALSSALLKGDEETAKLLIRSGADLENATSFDELKEVILQGKYEIARFMIREGANINAQFGGETLLLVAIMRRNDEMLKFLLQEGADAELPDSKGITPLDVALEQQNESAVSIIKQYVKYSEGGVANSNIDEEELDQKLHKAVLMGDLKACEDFIRQEADVNLCDSCGYRPLHHAAAGGHKALCKLLIEAGAYVNVKDRQCCTPLHYAVEGGHVDVCSFLLENGAHSHLTNNVGLTVLHSAVVADESEICLLLLKTKRTGEHKLTKEGCSALHIACEHGLFEVIKELISHKVIVNAKNNMGWTPLHYAAFYGEAEICEYLLGHNAKIDSQNDAGFTPLHCAAMRNHISIVHLLGEKGADVDLQNIHGDTALHLAAKNGNTAICDLLTGQGAQTVIQNNKGETALLAIRDNDELYVKLLERSPELTHIAANGRLFPLHLAVQDCKLPRVRELLEKRASVHAKTDDGWTPLHFAVARADTDIVQELLKKKASVHAKTNDGKLPLEMIMTWDSPSSPQKIAICELLLRYGASPTAIKPMNACQWALFRLPGDSELIAEDRGLIELFFKYGVNVVIKNNYGYCSLYSQDGIIRDLPSLEEADSLHESLFAWLARTRGNVASESIYRMILENSLCIPLLNNAEHRELLRNQILAFIICLKRVFSAQGFEKSQDLIYKILGSNAYLLQGIITLLIAGQLQKKKWLFPLRLPGMPLQFQEALIYLLKKTTLEYIIRQSEDKSVLPQGLISIARANEAYIRESCGYNNT